MKYKCSWMSPGTHLFCGQKVIGHGHNVCVGLQKTQYCRCSCIRKLRWVLPAVAFLAHKTLEGCTGSNINVGAKTRDVCKEQFYCS